MPWRTIAMHQKDSNFSEPTFWHVFVTRRRWTPGSFDKLLRMIADNVLANIMIVALDCRWLVHPYDGGMDLLLESSSVRDKFKARYSQWLSTRADGL
jgi:hypothetical protein